MRKSKPWTAEEISYIEKNVDRLTAVEMALELGRTVDSIRYRIRTTKPHKNMDKDSCLLAVHLLLANDLITNKQANAIKKRIESA